MAIIKRRGKKRISYAVKIYRSGGRQEWHGTYPTLGEAKEVERRELSKPNSLYSETCDSFAERWVEDYPRPRASTNVTNRRAIQPFARHFKGVRLADLDKPRARAFALRHRSSYASARAMLTDAVNDGYCATNPFSNLRLPQSRGRKDLIPLTEEQVQALADTALEVHGDYGPEFRALILFQAFTLMRPAEIFVLEWTDIDFENSLIRVDKTLSGDRWIEKPKNRLTKTIVLPPPALEALNQVPRRSDTERIFSTIRGRRFSKSSHHYAWNPVRSRFGSPDLEFYELKHFGCTYYLDALGMSAADVALQCGHTDGGRLVLELYGHPSRDLARERIKAAWDRRVISLEDEKRKRRSNPTESASMSGSTAAEGENDDRARLSTEVALESWKRKP